MGFLGSVGKAVGGFGSFLGDVLTGGALSGADAQRDANTQNVGLAREQMAFQERMSNSAYQRAMSDMGQAGLNPMLAFSQGGASSPSGAMGHVEPVNKSAGKLVSAGLAKAADAAQLKVQLDNQQSSTKLNEQNTEVAAKTAVEKESTTSKNYAQAHEARQRTSSEFVRMQNMATENKILRERHRSAAAEADQAEMERDLQSKRQAIDKSLSPSDAVMERVEQAVGTVLSGKGVLRRRGGTTRTYDVNPGTGEVYRERHTESE
ncbi:VP2 [Kummerowia striata gokushovirus]|nr:VP2 [Kummerowia striata gokushovirus]